GWRHGRVRACRTRPPTGPLARSRSGDEGVRPAAAPGKGYAMSQSRHGSGVVDAAFEVAYDAGEAVRAFLVSEQGKRLRHNLATAIIVGAPLISELPLVRRSWAA